MHFCLTQIVTQNPNKCYAAFAIWTLIIYTFCAMATSELAYQKISYTCTTPGSCALEVQLGIDWYTVT